MLTPGERGPSRRTALTSAAFAVPVIALSVAAPAVAASISSRILITPHTATGVAGTSAQPFSAVITGADVNSAVVWALPHSGFFSFDAAGTVKTTSLPGTAKPTIYALTPGNTAGSTTITATISGTSVSDQATYTVLAAGPSVPSNGAIVNDTRDPQRGFLSFGGVGSPVRMVQADPGQEFTIPAIDGAPGPVLCNGLAMTYVGERTGGFYWQPYVGAPTQHFIRPSGRKGRTSTEVFLAIVLRDTIYWIPPASGRVWDEILVLGPKAHRYDIAFIS